MRDDVLMKLTDRVLVDEAFRQRLRIDLDGTLQDEGFELGEAELAAVREFHQQGVGLSDEDLTAALATSGQRRQLG